MNKLFILPVLVLGTAALSFSVSAADGYHHPVRHVVHASTQVVERVGYGTVAVAKGAGHFVGGVFKGAVDFTTGVVNRL